MNKNLNYRKLVSIKASETTPLENPMWINVLNVGHWDTNYQGSFDVVTNDLDEMVTNFYANVRKGVPIDTNHDNAGANGWVEKLEVRNASELWALVEWTPVGFKRLSDKEYKYLSPEFAPVYNDPETSSFVANNVLIAAAVTNFPLMKGLQSIVANESIKSKTLYFNNDPTLRETKMTKKASENDSLEQQLDDIQDAFCALDPNPLGMYGFSIVETHQDATGAGYLIVSSYSDWDDNDYYRVVFTEDTATDTFIFEQPTKVEMTFTPMKDEENIMAKEKKVIASNKVRTVKAAADPTHQFEVDAEAKELAEAETAKKTTKTEKVTAPVVETPVVAPVEPVVEEPVVEEEVVEPVADEVKAGEFTLNPEILAKVGTPAKIKANDGSVKEVVDGKIVDDNEEIKASEKVAETIVAVEGSTETITAAELADLRKAKEESIQASAQLAKISATEKIGTLVFSEKSFKMPVESKDSVVEFYLALNEKQKEDFVGILEKLPSAKLFNEVGDAGSEADGAGAYEQISVKANEILAADTTKKMNYGQALQIARKQNPEMAKLANEHRATINVNKGK